MLVGVLAPLLAEPFTIFGDSVDAAGVPALDGVPPLSGTVEEDFGT